jgi:hypothetical protein
MNPIDLLKFLGDNPGLLWPLLALAVIWPMLRRVGSVIERAADGLIVAAPIAKIAAFLFLVHFIVVLISVVICLLFTEHMPPGINENWRGPFGQQADRFFM